MTLFLLSPVLRPPDHTRKFFFATDEFLYRLGAVLYQLDLAYMGPELEAPEASKWLIALYSRTFIPRKYGTRRRDASYSASPPV